ncbi:MAG: hypothetical protein J0L64_06805 [Acidobacteria bacterium]|nr:hypothetical protein [Acidobacteriota bacterium]
MRGLPLGSQLAWTRTTSTRTSGPPRPYGEDEKPLEHVFLEVGVVDEEEGYVVFGFAFVRSRHHLELVGFRLRIVDLADHDRDVHSIMPIATLLPSGDQLSAAGSRQAGT